VYLPDLQKRIAERDEQEAKRQLKDLAALKLDMKATSGEQESVVAGEDEEQEG
jgi:hypothetical protein